MGHVVKAMHRAAAAVLKCPVCKSTGVGETRKVCHSGYTDLDYTLWYCSGCGVRFWTPLVHPLAGYYESEQNDFYAQFHDGTRLRDPRIERFLERFSGMRGERVLDVGCSDGALMARLAALGNEVWGIDIDSKGIAAARRRGLANALHSTVEDFVTRAGREGLSFTCVTLFDVLEHLTDPVATLASLRGLLRDGAQLVVTVPNRERLFADGVSADFPPHHFFRFDHQSIRCCVERAGFRVEDVEQFQYGYSSGAAMTLLKRAVRGSPPPPSLVRHPTGAIREAPSSPGRGSIGRAVAAIEVAVRPVFAGVERATRRGFKLMCVARAAPT
jgi:SAM-dependent methyltransferase